MLTPMAMIDVSDIIAAAIIGLDELTSLVNVMATGIEVTFEMRIVIAVTTMRDGAQQGIENMSMRETGGNDAITETRARKGKGATRRA